MGLISRLKRITRGRIEAFLDSVEDPELVLPQLVDELADQVRQAGAAEAKALSAVKSAQRKLDEASGRAARLQRGAELAVQADRMNMARQALAAHMEAERDVQAKQAVVDSAESAHRDANSVRCQIQAQLKDLRTRRDEIIARARAARQKKDLLKTAAKSIDAEPDAKSILAEVARMEELVDHAEAQVEVADDLRQALGPTFPDERARNLERDAEVRTRLEALKAKLGRE